MSAQPSTELIVRDARTSDRETIVNFNLRLADETEGKALDRHVLERGVDAALVDPERLRYWVAEEPETHRIIGQTAITREWSDWRGGWIWWFQSVYVAADWRGRGVFRALHNHVRAAALSEADVIGLRLYVEVENHKAQATYKALGFKSGGYDVYEEIWSARFGTSTPTTL